MNARSEPPRLAANPRLPAEIALESAKRCDSTISGGGSGPFAINGATFVDWAPKPAYVIPRGQAAAFTLTNKTQVVQAMRLWGHVARLLHSMDDGWEPCWRDTTLIQPGRTVHMAFVRTTRANGHSNLRSPSIAQLEWEPGFRWAEPRDTRQSAHARLRKAKRVQETAR